MSATGEFSRRLRHLRNINDWTVQEMAEMTGVPKRTLDNYMQKKNAPQPGLDALVKISIGLGVSLDWLLLGEEVHALSQGVFVRLTTRAAALPFLQSLRIHIDQTKDQPDFWSTLFGDGKLMGLTPEQLALEIANEAGRRAEIISIRPVRNETMRTLDIEALKKGYQPPND